MTSLEPQPDRERRWRLQPFASFRYRGYPWLWAANVTHGAVQGGQGFLITWVVIEALNRDYNHGLMGLVGALPVLLLGLLAGRFADSRDRRLLLMGSHVAVALVLLLTGILAAGDLLSYGMTFLLVGLAAAATVIGQPVRLALIPAVVPRERILNANTLDALGMGLGSIALLPLTLGLDKGLPIEGAVVVLAAVSGLGALFLIPLRVPPREPGQAEGEANGEHPESVGVGGGIKDGFRFLWRTVELRLLFVVLLTAILIGPWAGLSFGAVEERLDISLRQWVVLSLILSAGVIVSTIALAFTRSLPRAGGLYGIIIIGSALAAFGLWFSSSYGLTGFLMGLFGLAIGLRGLLFLTLVQSHTPIALMGRVMGIFITLTAAAGMLAPLIARGGRALLQDDGWIVCSAIVLVGVVAMILWRNRGLRRMPSHPEPAKPADEEVTVAPSQG